MKQQAPMFHNVIVLQSDIESFQETTVKLCLETLLYSVASLKEKNTEKYTSWSFTFGFLVGPCSMAVGVKIVI